MLYNLALILNLKGTLFFRDIKQRRAYLVEINVKNVEEHRLINLYIIHIHIHIIYVCSAIYVYIYCTANITSFCLYIYS